MTIRWLRSADRSRYEQIQFVARDNPLAAAKLDDEIERQTEMLGRYPMLGREGREQGTRELVIGRTPFIAVYRIRRKRIEILCFLHGAQQWPRV